MRSIWDFADIINGLQILWVSYVFVYTFFVIIRWRIVIVSVIIHFLVLYNFMAHPGHKVRLGFKKIIVKSNTAGKNV